MKDIAYFPCILFTIMAVFIDLTEGTVNNGQSRNTNNIGHTRHRTKINKTKIITQHRKLTKDEEHVTDTTKPGGEPMCSRRVHHYF